MPKPFQIAILLFILAPGVAWGGFCREGERAKDEDHQLKRIGESEKKFGLYHGQTAVTIEGLANGYGLCGNHSLATPLYERALEIKKKLYGPDSTGLVMPMLALAMSYDFEGKSARADPIYEDLIVRFKKMVDGWTKDLEEMKKKNPSALTAEEQHLLATEAERPVSLLAQVESSAKWNNGLGRRKEAERLYKRAEWIRKKQNTKSNF